MAPMDTINPTDSRLRGAVAEVLNAHDLAGVMAHGAPDSEYDPELKDLVALIEEGTAITPEVVAGVWHKRFGDEDDTAEPPTPSLVALAAALLAAQQARPGPSGSRHR
jgi:hypothetical protein